MRSKSFALAGVILLLFALYGCATPEEGRRVAGGAAAGAAVGLALGAITGDSDVMMAGAIAGGASGAAFMYDQEREDRRTNTLATAIGGAKQGETADAAGTRHLADFTGDWALNIWFLDAAGKKSTAQGKARVVMSGKDELQLSMMEIVAADYPDTYSGTSLLKVSSENGFTIENRFSSIPEVRSFVGEYLPADNLYNFYPVGGTEGETVSGMIRSNVRIELRVSGTNLFVAEAYTFKDGAEIKMQSYRFARM